MSNPTSEWPTSATEGHGSMSFASIVASKSTSPVVASKESNRPRTLPGIIDLSTVKDVDRDDGKFYKYETPFLMALARPFMLPAAFDKTDQLVIEEVLGMGNKDEVDARRATERRNHERFGSFRGGRGGGGERFKREARPQISTSLEEASPTASPWDMPSSAAAAGSFGPDGAFRAEDDPFSGRGDPIQAMKEAAKKMESMTISPVSALSEKPFGIDERPLKPWKSGPSEEEILPSPPVPSVSTGSRLRMFENLRSAAPASSGPIAPSVSTPISATTNHGLSTPVSHAPPIPFEPITKQSSLVDQLGGEPLPTRHTPSPANQTTPPPAHVNLPQIPMPMMPPMPPHIPPGPPKWVYKDPQGQIQGPFTHVEMQDWYEAGYFQPNLPIKTVDAPEFDTVQRLVERFPNGRPFLDDAEMRMRMPPMPFGMMSPKGFPPVHPGMRLPGMSQGAPPQMPGLPPTPGHLPGMPTPGHLPPIPAGMDPHAFAQQFMLQQQMIQMRMAMAMQAMQQNQELSPALQSQGLSAPQSVASPHLGSQSVSEQAMSPPPVNVPVVEDVRDDESWVQVTAPVSPEVVAAPIVPPSPQSKAPWVGEKVKPKMSLKEIQDMEEKQRKEEEKKAQAAQAAQAKLQVDTKKVPIVPERKNSATGTPWSAATAKKLSLQDIMAEEEKREKDKRAKQEAQRAALEASGVPTDGWSTGGGKRFADAVASPSSAGGPAWSSIAKPKIAPAVLPSKPMVVPSKPEPLQTPKEEDGWQVQGPRSKNLVKTPSTPAAVDTPVGLSQETSDFLRWCKSQLNPVAKTGAINVHEFLAILQSIPVSETSTIVDICVDTLGISTAIDPRKFANEYCKRRKAEKKG